MEPSATATTRPSPPSSSSCTVLKSRHGKAYTRPTHLQRSCYPAWGIAALDHRPQDGPAGLPLPLDGAVRRIPRGGSVWAGSLVLADFCARRRGDVLQTLARRGGGSGGSGGSGSDGSGSGDEKGDGGGGGESASALPHVVELGAGAGVASLAWACGLSAVGGERGREGGNLRSVAGNANGTVGFDVCLDGGVGIDVVDARASTTPPRSGSVVLTDRDPAILQLLKHNCALNAMDPERCSVARCCWGHAPSIDALLDDLQQRRREEGRDKDCRQAAIAGATGLGGDVRRGFDLVLAAECTYDAGIYGILFDTIYTLLGDRPGQGQDVGVGAGAGTGAGADAIVDAIVDSGAGASAAIGSGGGGTSCGVGGGGLALVAHTDHTPVGPALAAAREAGLVCINLDTFRRDESGTKGVLGCTTTGSTDRKSKDQDTPDTVDLYGCRTPNFLQQQGGHPELRTLVFDHSNALEILCALSLVSKDWLGHGLRRLARHPFRPATDWLGGGHSSRRRKNIYVGKKTYDHAHTLGQHTLDRFHGIWRTLQSAALRRISASGVGLAWGRCAFIQLPAGDMAIQGGYLRITRSGTRIRGATAMEEGGNEQGGGGVSGQGVTSWATRIVGKIDVSKAKGVVVQGVSISNPTGDGVGAHSGCSLLLRDCEVAKCHGFGISVTWSDTDVDVVACRVHHNGQVGVYAKNTSVRVRVLHTDVHHNRRAGIMAVGGAAIDVYANGKARGGEATVGEATMDPSESPESSESPEPSDRRRRRRPVPVMCSHHNDHEGLCVDAEDGYSSPTRDGSRLTLHLPPGGEHGDVSYGNAVPDGWPWEDGEDGEGGGHRAASLAGSTPPRMELGDALGAPLSPPGPQRARKTGYALSPTLTRVLILTWP